MYKTYLVGGAVRDKLLGLEATDYDRVVVGARPEDLEKQGYTQVGKDFPVFLHPYSGDQYALARIERKTGTGYIGFETSFSPDVTLVQDLQRRDLTINAIACDEESGVIIDPFDGQSDLRNGILRHVSAAFVEDPLRVLRVARFAAKFASLQFRVAPLTMELLRQITSSGELDNLVPERVWQETQRALEMPVPSKFFDVLYHANALYVVFPELFELISSYMRTVDVLNDVSYSNTDPVVRFATLVQHTLKIDTHSDDVARRVTLITQLCNRLRIPTKFQELAVLTAKHREEIDALITLDKMDPSALLNLFMNLDAFRRPQRFKQFLTVWGACSGLNYYTEDIVSDFELAFDVAKATVFTKEDIDGLQGPEIAAMIKAKRLETLVNHIH